ncbi:MAG: flavin-containing monooxygenase [Gammaproteobacteria bacterium]|uniref:flavin-containing monooxygenase n=1 Tax=Bradyrhizobium sp. TaxID=376 RepID=UPI003D0D7FCA
MKANETTTTASAVPSARTQDRFDAIIIGAGIAGMYQLYRLREIGLSVRVLEAGSGVGGTWYWNRYPGCRFDSESYSYGYSFSEEVLREWEWSEHFAPQPETLRYLNFVADKFDFRRDIDFNTRVVRARFDEATNEWEVGTEAGLTLRCRFLISATGPLSAPQMPAIEGVADFKGEAYHTAMWPRDPAGFGGRRDITFAGKRVGVIGTGATAVQLIQEIAKDVGELYVFQRTPNWCAPLLNGPITAQQQREIKANYPAIFRRCRETFGAFLHGMDERSALSVTAAEREAFFEKLYAEPGFGIWLGNFGDIMSDQRANDLISDFIASKIRQRVKDPKVAEKLIPRNHGFGIRRVPMETNYYEVYNQPNVTLVDLREEPIERITAGGIETSARRYDLDMIVYATGFDAVMGALNRIDITGVGGQKLKDKWAHGPRTYLGMQTAGFPNFFTLVGPHNGATFCNIPRCIEQNVEWVAEFLRHLHARGIARVEATPEAEAEWTQHVDDTAARTLFPTADSWFMGINENIPGRQTRTFMLYAGGMPRYRARCDEVAAQDYAGFRLG